MTLPCGEQVMPFHEQGVELEGFHEEEIATKEEAIDEEQGAKEPGDDDQV